MESVVSLDFRDPLLKCASLVSPSEQPASSNWETRWGGVAFEFASGGQHRLTIGAIDLGHAFVCTPS